MAERVTANLKGASKCCVMSGGLLLLSGATTLSSPKPTKLTSLSSPRARHSPPGRRSCRCRSRCSSAQGRGSRACSAPRRRSEALRRVFPLHEAGSPPAPPRPRLGADALPAGGKSPARFLVIGKYSGNDALILLFLLQRTERERERGREALLPSKATSEFETWCLCRAKGLLLLASISFQSLPQFDAWLHCRAIVDT